MKIYFKNDFIFEKSKSCETLMIANPCIADNNYVPPRAWNVHSRI